MGLAPSTPAGSSRRQPSMAATPFDRRLAKILTHAAAVFCEKGYQGASVRDLARASRMSMSGMYYYFQSKERLLYLIQKHAFSTIIAGLRARLDAVQDPEQRIRAFILNHLDFSLANQKAMKVLSHEDEALKNGYGAEIAALKREYYRLCLGLLDDFKRERALQFSSRTAVLSLFGMMNWLYTWYNPRVDGSAEELAGQMAGIFLEGLGSRREKSRRKKAAN
ncbi:MAG TPA: TetR/AcrR family transcriptional regulator [Terriglobales bacterium]|nr:TetR/AcrR family transcriptional regulator [Terriglobales bacterium]